MQLNDLPISSLSLEAAIDPHSLTVAPETPLVEVIALMSQGRRICTLPSLNSSTNSYSQSPAQISCALVMQEEQLIGVLTERDFVRFAAKGMNLDGVTAAEVMTRKVITLKQSEFWDIFTVLNLFRQYQIRHLPILNDKGQLLGIVTPESIRQGLQPPDLLRLRSVGEVMTSEVIHAPPSASVLHLAQLMAQYRVSCVVIAEETTEERLVPVGIVTERDIVQFQALELDFLQLQAQTVMSSPLFCLSPDDSLWVAHQEMQQRRVQRLVVTGEHGELVGIITQTSLLQTLNPAELYNVIQVLQQEVSQQQTELTERKQVEEILRNVAMGVSAEIGEAFFNSLVEYLAKTLGWEYAFISELIEADGERMTTVAIYSDGQIQENFSYDLEQTPCGNAIQTRHLCMYPCQLRQELPQNSWLKAMGMNSYIATPLFSSTGRVFGLIGVMSRQLLHDTKLAQEVLQIFAARAATELERRQAEASLQSLNEELEIRVQERTVELKRINDKLQQEILERHQAETELQQAKDQLEAVLDAVPGCVSWISSDLHYLGVNRNIGELFHLPPEAFVGQKVGSLKPNDEFAQHASQFFNTPLQESSVEFGVNVDGSEKIYLVAAQKYHQNKAAVFVGIDITAHREVENALLSSIATNRALLNAIPDLMFRIKGDGTLANCKAPKDSDVFGREGQFIGKKIHEVMSPPVAQSFLHCVEQTLQTAELQVLEYRLHGNNSTSHWEARFAATESDEVLALVRDITERKQAQEALRQQLAAVEASIDGVAILNQNSEYIYLNKAHVQLFSYDSADELLGKSWTELYDPEEMSRLERDVFPILMQQGHWRGEARAKRKDGSTIAEEVSLTVTEDGNLICVCRDITERKQMEEALRENEQRFRQMAESIREVFWMTDVDKQQMIYISPAYEEIWGRSCESIYQHPKSFLDTIHPDDRESVVTAFKKQIRGDYDEEYRIVQPSGEERWIRDRAFPIGDLAGQVYRIVGIAEDITEYKRAKQEILKALEKEKELNELKSRFIAMTSHEFRTPLTTILGSAELLKYYSQSWTEEKKLTHLDRIHDKVKHMTRMLDDVLLLGKAESGKMEFLPYPMDVVEFCEGLAEEFSLSTGTEYTIAFTPHCQCIEACMDEKLLRHILSNLLANAIKYSPKGSTIHFEIACQNKVATFKIKDQGIGIPKEDQQHLFESFHRAQNVGKIPGTGLGLAIVKKSVDVHGGEIRVDSEEGVGTTFTVMIPFNSQLPHGSEANTQPATT